MENGVQNIVTTKNVNVGIMGHVDAGKTSLARFISTTASTAAFDKNPQSRERGITLDLGFSSLQLPLCNLQVTLVDCPGHASLFKTVMGAAQIIDAIILVIDVEKGIQTQTAECLVLAEIVTDKLLFALAKIDIFNQIERVEKVNCIIEKLKRILEKTKFKDAPFVPVSCRIPETKNDFISGLEKLLTFTPTLTISSTPLFSTRTKMTGPAIIAIDHAFNIKGQGSILTGTILQGQIKVGDIVDLTECKVQKKIKSIQSFKQSVAFACQGDRVGINLGSLNTEGLERTIIAHVGVLKPAIAFLININFVSYYKSPIDTQKGGFRMHISVLHDTFLGTITFLTPSTITTPTGIQEEFNIADSNSSAGIALIEAPLSVVAPVGFLVLGSKLDIGLDVKTCRIAFYGNVMHCFNERSAVDEFKKRKIFKWKIKQGRVDRIVDEYRLIGRDIASKNGGLQKLIGKKCTIEQSDGNTVIATGVISSTFGTSGKFNVTLTDSSLLQTLLDLPHHCLRIVVKFKVYSLT